MSDYKLVKLYPISKCRFVIILAKLHSPGTKRAMALTLNDQPKRQKSNAAHNNFMRSALIAPFVSSHMPTPRERSSYNNDVSLSFFSSSARTYAGKQRKGIQEEHMESLSIEEHVEEALSAPFFLSLQTPLPQSITTALDFVAHTPSHEITSFWEEQLSRLQTLTLDASPTDKTWNNLIPATIRPAAGKLRLAPLMSLMAQHNMGGSIWLQQFLFGFKLIGKLGQEDCFPLSEKMLSKKPLDANKIASSISSRFSDRARKSGFKNAARLWEEAQSQQKEGWLSEAFPLSFDGQPFILRNPNLNIAFRFGVEQADKLRACDDLRHSMTNLACVVLTPIKLASWDHVAEMCSQIREPNRDWHFFKADHEAAYKQLPIDEGHAKLAVIALRSPHDHKWYGFMSRTLMFGAISAVLHYNVFSRILAELACRIFGLPMLSYFDDFGALLPAEIAKQGLLTFSRMCTLLGIKLKLQKSEVGPAITFLGLLGTFPSKEGGMDLTVSLPQDKAAKWAADITQYQAKGIITHPELEKLIGKLCFSQTCLFGKFARTQLRCLYRKLYAPKYKAALSKHENLTLSWWIDVLLNLTPRIPRASCKPPDFVLYTDAATSSRSIAAILFQGGSNPPIVQKLATSRVPKFWTSRFNAKNEIFGMELLAPLAFIWFNRKQLTNKTVNLYIDNNNVVTSLVRGDSGADFIAAMIAMFWRIAEAHSIDVWIGRVSSKRNPADLPSREVQLPFKVLRRMEFRELFKLFQITKKWDMTPMAG